MVLAPQTKSKLTISSKPNQTIFNQTQSKEIYLSKFNQSKPKQTKTIQTKQKSTKAKQTKTDQTKLDLTKYLKGFVMSKSAAQLLYAPVLVIHFGKIVIFVYSPSCGLFWTPMRQHRYESGLGWAGN